MRSSSLYFGRRWNVAAVFSGVGLCFAVMTIMLLVLRQEIFSSFESDTQWYKELGSTRLPQKPMDDHNTPDDFVPALSSPAIPNIQTLTSFYLHYIRFKPDNNNTDFRFTDFLSVMSGVQYLKPDEILIHGDFTPTGPYWNNLTSRNLIKQVPMVRPTEIVMRGGKTKKLGFIEHSADIAKLDVLLKHGGIAVDFDVFFVRGQHIRDILEKKKSITCYGDRDGNNIGFVAGHKDSKFLWAWRRSYRDIYLAEWNFNQAAVSTYLTALFPEDVYVLDHVCNNPHPHYDMKNFFTQYGKLEWKNSAAIHSYERFGGVKIDSPDDLLSGSLTTHKEMLQHIYFNKSLPSVNATFQDEVHAEP